MGVQKILYVHLPISILVSYSWQLCLFVFSVRIQKVLRLLVASADGTLYVYNLDTNEGGDCTLLKQYRFVPVSLILLHIWNIVREALIYGMHTPWNRILM